MILLNKPINPNIKKLTKYLEKVNNSGWYTNFGPLHQELTENLEEYLGVENLLLVSNGTLAIQVACKTLNVKTALTTPFSFVATTSSMLWQNIDTSFCDIDKNSFNISPISIESSFKENDKFDAIVATHVYGNPCDIDAIDSISKKFNKKIIYDAAHAFGVKLFDKSVLSFGDASTLSFHSTKVFHTVEGGAIVFKNKSDFSLAKKLINFGINNNGVISDVGINAKLNEYQSAVGLTILDNISNILSHRSDLFTQYYIGLNSVVKLPIWHKHANFNGAYMPILLSSESEIRKVMSELSLNNIQYRRYFSPSLDEIFPEQKSFNIVNSQKISSLVLCLPLHFYMTIFDVKKVINTVKKALL